MQEECGLKSCLDRVEFFAEQTGFWVQHNLHTVVQIGISRKVIYRCRGVVDDAPGLGDEIATLINRKRFEENRQKRQRSSGSKCVPESSSKSQG